MTTGYIFTPQTAFAVGSAPTSVTKADVNGDGRADLITTKFDSYTDRCCWARARRRDHRIEVYDFY